MSPYFTECEPAKQPPGEWDYFQSLALADARLEPIREMVAPLYGPGFDPASDAVLAEAIVQADKVARADEVQEADGS